MVRDKGVSFFRKDFYGILNQESYFHRNKTVYQKQCSVRGIDMADTRPWETWGMFGKQKTVETI